MEGKLVSMVEVVKIGLEWDEERGLSYSPRELIRFRDVDPKRCAILTKALAEIAALDREYRKKRK